ncbi:sensor histidine kinase [Saccharicrinis sp. FJH2]|uniref:sensor histidine kinase n=1 Tax=Saccharicrinis sp. FJH65 TaxID=3344659 RepID=UPI0035F244A4
MRKGPLTFISSLSLLVLVIIQIYVIWNYYNVKSENFDMNYSSAILSTIDNNSYDSLSDSLDIMFNKTASSFLMEFFNPLDSTVQDYVLTKFDNILLRYDSNTSKVKDYLLNNNLDTVFKTYYSINEISFMDFDNKIPVYKNIQTTLQEKAKGIYINTYYKEGNYYAIQYDYYIDFVHKHNVILSEMKGLLIMVILTLSAVIFTFVYTLITLQRQKKLTELKDDFINNISHEFKTPLSIISVATSSLKQEKIKKDDLKFKEIYTQLEKQNKVLSKMIDNVIDASLLDRKSIQSEKENVPLKQYFSEIVSTFLNTEAAEKNVQIIEEYSIPDDFIYHINTLQFSRAIGNLLNNSIKYCKLDPVIEIGITLNEQLRIEIKDNGIGIKENHEKDVFNKFFRADNPDKVKGLGLGLYIVKRIIEDHHGTIRLESEWGKGTTAIITLPK